MSYSSDQTYFRELWLGDPAFTSWLVAATSNTQARFKRCSKRFELSNMDAQALKSHAVGENHLSLTLSYFSFSEDSKTTKYRNNNKTK